MFRIRTFLSILVVSALCALAPSAGPALASHNEAVYFEGSTILLNAKTREAALAQLKHLGVRALRVELFWVQVAPSPTSSRRPAFDATNPANYNWGGYDWVLEQAKELHWPVLLTVTGPVPKWATSTHRDFVTRPDDREFQQFMTAVARHYGPEVSVYAIWNEPNHPRFLRPQFNSRGLPASPRIYRGLFQAGYAGLQAAGIAHPQVLIGETAPGGEFRVNPREGVNKDVAPITFIREMLCLNAHWVRSGTCGKLSATGYAHHAYSNAIGPFYAPPGRENVTIGVLSRLTHALDVAARAGGLPAHLPVYLTEYGVNSKPNKYLGVPASQQAEFDAISERIAYQNPRVAAFSQYLLKDDPLAGALVPGGVGFQTGLEYLSGKLKPLYFGWPLPLTVSKHGHRYTLWGLVRPAQGATTVTVEVRGKRSHSFHVLRIVRTNSARYWVLNSTTAGSSWRVTWIAPDGTLYTGPPIRAY
jgi:hypothetical protein